MIFTERLSTIPFWPFTDPRAWHPLVHCTHIANIKRADFTVADAVVADTLDGQRLN